MINSCSFMDDYCCVMGGNGCRPAEENMELSYFRRGADRVWERTWVPSFFV